MSRAIAAAYSSSFCPRTRSDSERLMTAPLSRDAVAPADITMLAALWLYGTSYRYGLVSVAHQLSQTKIIIKINKKNFKEKNNWLAEEDKDSRKKKETKKIEGIGYKKQHFQDAILALPINHFPRCLPELCDL
ncbi:hypothetical protein H2248_012450 [Termitomyces sp. 'cryptogamus']|nr:hypothetical protein H2248_012450 [Termitomyces sp. 'cryptogamus']